MTARDIKDPDGNFEVPLPEQRSIITQLLAVQSGDKVHPCANNKDTGELHEEVSCAPSACLDSFSFCPTSFVFTDGGLGGLVNLPALQPNAILVLITHPLLRTVLFVKGKEGTASEILFQ